MVPPMTLLHRSLRALILALVLPALLVPSGWSARLCLSTAVASVQQESCCEIAPAPAPEELSCCERKAAQVPQEGECAGEDCRKSCCPVLEAGEIQLVLKAEAGQALSAPAQVEVAVLSDVPPSASHGRAWRACTHSLAPPRATSPLPLRI